MSDVFEFLFGLATAIIFVGLILIFGSKLERDRVSNLIYTNTCSKKEQNMKVVTCEQNISVKVTYDNGDISWELTEDKGGATK